MTNLQSINGFSSTDLSSLLRDELATGSVNSANNKAGAHQQSIFQKMLNEANGSIENQAGIQAGFSGQSGATVF